MNKRDFAMGCVAGTLIGFSVGTIVASPDAPVTQLASSTSPSACDRPLDRDDLSIKVNEYRISKGREQLATVKEMNEYAQLRAEEISAAGSTSHETKYVSYFAWSRSKSFEGGMKTVGEIVTGPVNDPCQAVAAFAASPTHEQAMSSDIMDVRGIGIKDGYVVILLGDSK